jgi:lipopolysaccharide transport system ATP-binding protein
VIEILGVTKRYRGQGPRHLVQIPGRPGRWYDRRVRRDAEAEVEVDLDGDLGVDDDEVDDVVVDREPPPSDLDIWALRGVTLDIRPGTLLGIIGPNGAGKTTLLRILTRLTPPTGGRVVLRGRVAPFVPSLPGFMLPKDSLRRSVGQIAQFYGLPKALALQRTDRIVELAELTQSLDQRVESLSRGELQRFAFAIAVELEPAVLVADDALAVGDKHFQQVCLAEIRRRVDAGLAVVFASHDLDLVVKMCDEVALLEEGIVVEHGSPQAIVDRYVYGTASPPTGGASSGDACAISSSGIFTITGRPTRSVHTSEAALVETEVVVDQAPTKLRCTLSLRGPDVIMRAVQPAPVEIATAGRYVVSAYLPAGALPVGRYRADVAAIALANGVRHPLGVLREAFSFDVFTTSAIAEAPQSAGTPTKRQLPLVWSASAADKRW